MCERALLQRDRRASVSSVRQTRKTCRTRMSAPFQEIYKIEVSATSTAALLDGRAVRYPDARLRGVARRRCRSDSIFYFGCHGHESLFHVRRVLGARLKERNTKAVGVFLKIIKTIYLMGKTKKGLKDSEVQRRE